MANGTRLRQQTTSYNQSFEEALQSARDVNQKLDVLIEALQKEEARRHEIMMQENARRHEQLLELIRSRFVHAKGKGTVVQVPIEKKHRQQYMPYMELSFPDFNGTDPKGWLRNCEQYFDRYQVPEQQWIGIASMHIEGDARFWKQAYFFNRPRVNWSEFSDAICKRFTAAKEGYPIREFNTYEQKHLETLQMENSNGHDDKLSDSASRPEELPRLHAAQPNPSKLNSAITTPRTENKGSKEGNLKDNIIPSPISANKGEEPPPGIHKLLAAQQSTPKAAYTVTTPSIERNEIKVQGTVEEFGPLPALKATEGGDSSLNNSEINSQVEVRRLEQNHYADLKMKVCNRRYEVKLRDSVGKPEELLRVLTAQPPPPKHAHTNSVEVESTDVVGSTVNNSEKVAKFNFARRTTMNKQKNSPDLFYKGLRQNHKFWAQLRVLKLEELDQVPGTDWVKIYRQLPFDPGPNQVTLHSIERATHMPIITSKLPMVIKHRAQLLAAQPYRIKPEATKEKTHACIQKPHREITDSTQKKEFVAILLEVNNQVHANSFPKMEFLMSSGNNLRNWIGGYEQCFKLHQISDQQENSEYFKVQRLIQHSRLTGACLVKGFVNEHKELGAIIMMPHPCSRFLAYEQDKLQESNRNLGVTLHIKGECKALTLIICKWMQAVQNRSEEDHLLTEFHTSRAWQVDMGIEQFTRWSGIERDMHQLVQDCEVCLRAKEENRPKHCYKKLKLEEWWSYTRFHISTGKRILQGPVARRLRLPEGSKGEPPPQQVPPSILPTRDASRVRTKVGNTSDWRKATQATGYSQTQFKEFHEFHP
uniref:Retrotransposon gag domain-containing protein n=1 Tax=Ananas comosus var. bracteatus TaxID=296719 RepID=A0A6V7NNQ3_ANACO|nr:unnamed protein product [Ananas comosus var. bracteatus]